MTQSHAADADHRHEPGARRSWRAWLNLDRPARAGHFCVGRAVGSLDGGAASSCAPSAGSVVGCWWCGEGGDRSTVFDDSGHVRRWRARFEVEGVGGVGVIAAGRGRKSWLPAGVTVAEVVRVTREETPDDTSTHWSTRTLGERFGIGKDTVARIWRDHGLKPWRVDTFKISTDRRFEEKLVERRRTRRCGGTRCG